MKSPVLITGGAGYIGSHVVWALVDRGYSPVVIDNLSSGKRSNLPETVPFYHADIADRAVLSECFSTYAPRYIMHFAGSIVVPESVECPVDYYQNNVAQTLTLLEEAIKWSLEGFIFSSTAAVYGPHAPAPVGMDTPCAPANPYGHSKFMVEQILQDAAAAHGFQTGILRYFNVAGADKALRCGQVGPQVSHLIRIICKVITGEYERLDIYGDDYNTPDGTCIRDYIHVSDLADLHVLALEYCMRERQSLRMNAGYGHGYSVKEVVKAAESVCGRELNTQMAPRRAGDVPVLVADANWARTQLQWQPKLDHLETIIASALAWEQKNSK